MALDLTRGEVLDRGLRARVASPSERQTHVRDRNQDPTITIAKAVNIAAVPKYSPFRYPGGKTWLIPQIRSWLAAREETILFEPFAGGSTASLTAVLEGYVEKAVLVELDRRIAAVWQTILSTQCCWLVDRILAFRLNKRTVQDLLVATPRSIRELALQTIVLNRVRSGGILSDNARLIRSGERDRGIRSRWYPETLALRILNIYSVRHRIEIVHGDGIAAIRKHRAHKRMSFFVDPPYQLRKGARPLYRHNDVDLPNLMALLSLVQGSVFLTCGDTPTARVMASTLGFTVRQVAFRGNGGTRTTELLLYR